MASSGCWKCLARPSGSLTSQLALRTPGVSAAFSTTTARAALPIKAKKPSQARPALKAKGSKTLRIKKKAPAKPSGKPPMPGERKAMRKRIVLSNTNALEVPMMDFNEHMVADPTMAGKVVALPGEVVDSLRAVEAFKVNQGWGLFRKPALLLREESAVLGQKMVAAEKSKEAVRLVIDGERGSGKSLMLLHALSAAFLRGWIVLSIPEGKVFFSVRFQSTPANTTTAAQDLCNASTEYAPLPGTNPTIYTQNVYTANFLAQIQKSNSVLQTLHVTKSHNLPIPLPEKTTLARLCELGARDPDISWPIFQAFWAEITGPARPPVLFTLDSLSFTMGLSAYRSASYELIHAHDLALVQHFVTYLSGEKPLPNGGAILGATSRSHAPVSASLELALKQAIEKQQHGEIMTKKDPYGKKYDTRAEDKLKSVEVLKLKGLSKVEARGLMEYWAQSGLLRSRVDERLVTEKWALAGNGIVGEIERGVLRMRI